MTRYNFGYSVIHPRSHQAHKRRHSRLDKELNADRQHIPSYKTYMDMYAEEERRAQKRARYPDFDPEEQDAIINAPEKPVDMAKMWAAAEKEEELERQKEERTNSWVQLSAEMGLPLVRKPKTGLGVSPAAGSDILSPGRRSAFLNFAPEDEDFLVDWMIAESGFSPSSSIEDVAAIDDELAWDDVFDLTIIGDCQVDSSSEHLECPRGLSPSSSVGDVTAVDDMLNSDDMFDLTSDECEAPDLTSSTSSGSSSQNSERPTPCSAHFLAADGRFKHDALPDLSSATEERSYADLPSATTTQYSSLLTPDDETTFAELSVDHAAISVEGLPCPIASITPLEGSPARSRRRSCSVHSSDNVISLSFPKVPVLKSPENAGLYARRSARLLSAHSQKTQDSQ